MVWFFTFELFVYNMRPLRKKIHKWTTKKLRKYFSAKIILINLQIAPAKIYGVGPVTVEKQLFKDGMRKRKGK